MIELIDLAWVVYKSGMHPLFYLLKWNAFLSWWNFNSTGGEAPHPGQNKEHSNDTNNDTSFIPYSMLTVASRNWGVGEEGRGRTEGWERMPRHSIPVPRQFFYLHDIVFTVFTTEVWVFACHTFQPFFLNKASKWQVSMALSCWAMTLFSSRPSCPQTRRQTWDKPVCPCPQLSVSRLS